MRPVDGVRRQRAEAANLVRMTDWTLPLGLPLLDETFPLPLDQPFTFDRRPRPGCPCISMRTLERRGFIRRMLKGVYVVAQSADSRPLRAAALALVVPHTAVVTDWTACWLLDWHRCSRAITCEPPHAVGLPSASAHAAAQRACTNGGARTLPPVGPRAGSAASTSPRRCGPLGISVGWCTATARSAAWTPCCGSATSRSTSSSRVSTGSRACAASSSCGRWCRSSTGGPSRRASRRCGCGGLTFTSLPEPDSAGARSWPAASRSTASTSACPSCATGASTTVRSSIGTRKPDTVATRGPRPPVRLAGRWRAQGEPLRARRGRRE